MLEAVLLIRIMEFFNNSNVETRIKARTRKEFPKDVNYTVRHSL
ncbi:hypothetical protein LBBP_03981 [Leptospira borgpetersenii serovar Ballum]|uniref:Uncharacterized protein n=1 Tax=Leptospira borgpetersenii serovar Ballum TaxID=280505 RepID=A0A0S2IXW4_LEPBO|nr:hypothetical protein LBBP_03981 [Leptospira borgpetersenii serovar Ballum]